MAASHDYPYMKCNWGDQIALPHAHDYNACPGDWSTVYVSTTTRAGNVPRPQVDMNNAVHMTRNWNCAIFLPCIEYSMLSMIALILDAQSWLQIHCSWPCLFCCPYLAITSGYSINHFLVYNVMRLSASSSSVLGKRFWVSRKVGGLPQWSSPPFHGSYI